MLRSLKERVVDLFREELVGGQGEGAGGEGVRRQG